MYLASCTFLQLPTQHLSIWYHLEPFLFYKNFLIRFFLDQNCVLINRLFPPIFIKFNILLDQKSIDGIFVYRHFIGPKYFWTIFIGLKYFWTIYIGTKFFFCLICQISKWPTESWKGYNISKFFLGLWIISVYKFCDSSI